MGPKINLSSFGLPSELPARATPPEGPAQVAGNARFFLAALHHGTAFAWCQRLDVYVNVDCQLVRVRACNWIGQAPGNTPWNAVERALQARKRIAAVMP